MLKTKVAARPWTRSEIRGRQSPGRILEVKWTSVTALRSLTG